MITPSFTTIPHRICYTINMHWDTQRFESKISSERVHMYRDQLKTVDLKLKHQKQFNIRIEIETSEITHTAQDKKKKTTT